MSWADIKRRYERGGLATQSTEDMCARRILRACGLDERRLFKFERDNGLRDAVRDDTTLYERAVAAAKAHSQAGYSLPPVRDVRSKKEAVDMLREIPATYPTIVYRIRMDDPRAMRLYPANEIVSLGELPAVCTVERVGDCAIVGCDAQTYYDKLLKREDSDGRHD